MKDTTLTGKQKSKFRDALVAAYPAYYALKQMLSIRLEKKLEVLVGTGTLNNVVFDLVLLAQSEDWLLKLLQAARAENPGNAALLAFEGSLPIDVVGKSAQRLSRIPHRRQEDIVGREEDLKDLQGRLASKGTVVLVNGMGGIGKTTLAEVYANKYEESYNYMLWVTQLPKENLMNSFLKTNSLLENLGINSLGKDPDILYREIFLKLKNITAKPNLLVIDNADENLLEAYTDLQELRNWHILVTSREYFGKELLNIKELGFLSEEEAIALFQRHYKASKITEAEIRALVKLLEYHTLAIEIVAKTAETKKKTAAELKNIFKEDPNIPHVEVRHGGLNINRKVAKINAYLDKMFVLAALNEEEHWLLLQMLCLPLEAHSYELLEALIHPELHNKADSFPDLLVGLANKGWLLYNPSADSYKLHRIIAEVLDRKLNKEILWVAPLIEEIAKRLDIDETKDNPVDKFEWIPFGEAILKYFEEGEIALIAELQDNLAMVLKALGNYIGSKHLLEKALITNKVNFGETHPITGRSYSNLALVFKALGDYAEAKKLLEIVLTSNLKNLEEDHPNKAAVYSNLGTVLQKLGDYEGAKVTLIKALTADEKNFGVEHPNTTKTYSNLATVLMELGDYTEAKKLLEKALAANEKNFGLEHPSTAITYSNLGTTLHLLSDYTEAKILLEKALVSNEKNFGAEHPNTAMSYSNLALVLKDLGNNEDAKVLLEKALAADEKNFEEHHPAIAICHSNLALVLRDLGDYKGAKVLLEKALVSDFKNSRNNHPTTAIHYFNLALVLQDLGDYIGAKVLLKKSYQILSLKLGENHPNTKTVKNNLDELHKL